MNTVKRYFGLLWMGLALFIAYDRGLDSLTKLAGEKLEDRVFGYVLLLVLLPIVVGGLLLFGWYAWRGEYDDTDSPPAD